MATQPRHTQSWITPDRTVLIALVLAAAVYCRDISYDFILDDVPLILINENLASWRNWKTAFIAGIFPAGSLVQAVPYRPVYVLWLLLNQQLFGAVVPWWHVTSLLLHLVVTLLVYQLAVKILRDTWTAALAALLFAFHPIHVESVAYVSASTDLLVALFALISFLFYVRFREEGTSLACYGVSILAAALAMLSKESGAMLPWMLVAYEALREPALTFATRRDWKRYAWTIPFFGVVGAYAVSRTLLFGRDLVPGGQRLGGLQNIPIVLMAYLRNVVWPVHLSFYYPPEWTWQWTLARAAALVFGMISVVFLWNRFRDKPGPRLQLLWAAILIVPPLTGIFIFAQDDWIHDRHMYLASVSFCLIFAALLRDAQIDAKLPRTACAFASALIVALLLFETAIQLPRFRDEITLYRSTLQIAPSSAIVHSHYASALWGNQHDEGLQQYLIATELSPQSAFFHEQYAGALASIGRDDEASTEYTRALQWAARPTPLRALILYRLAMIEVSHSNYQAGAEHMREALKIAPQAQGYHALLAQTLRQEGYAREADEQLQLEAVARKQ